MRLLHNKIRQWKIKVAKNVIENEHGDGDGDNDHRDGDGENDHDGVDGENGHEDADGGGEEWV